MTCRHCQAPRGTCRTADRLCWRCHAWSARHGGELPPKKSTVLGDKSESLEVRMSALLLEHVKSGAKAEKTTPSEWVRRACEARALRSAAKK